jgi:hypothetical protein
MDYKIKTMLGVKIVVSVEDLNEITIIKPAVK